MRFIFKTDYAQDVRLAQHGGHVFWYGLLGLFLVTAPWLLDEYWLAQLTFVLIYSVVTGIAGASRIALRFTGMAGHAGTVAMPLRRDALAAAAEIVVLAERLARETDGLLATVGQLQALPGASNVIPGEVRMSLDVRSPSDATRLTAVDALHAAAKEAARSRGLEMEWTTMLQNPAVPLDPGLTATLAEAVRRAGHPVHELPSGAGHDAVVMSAVCPAAMLFIRCEGGISHNPAESVSAPDVAAALQAMAGLVALLAEPRA